MFLDFFHLREQPFGVTPDPRYLYFSPGHREALASLFYGIETGRGFVSLIAQPGMGKTTLLFQLLQRWKAHVHSAFIFQTQCDSRELIRYLLEDFGIKSDGQDLVGMHALLNDFLYRETKAGKRVVVFIDEAQNLSESVLETVRLLSDFEAPDKKLLQIVLAGQPELGERLARPNLAQLRQRIAVQARLDPLPASEVVHYIHHRLQVAGYEGPELFTPGAFALIAELSRGIPRLINNICFNAMSTACATRSKQIFTETVREAAADLALDSPIPSLPTPQRRPAPRVTPALDSPLPGSFVSWMRENVFRRQVFQTSVLSALLGSLAVYVGARTGAARMHNAAQAGSNIATAPATLGTGTVAAQNVAAQNVAVQNVSAQPTTRNTSLSVPIAAQREDRENSQSFFTYVVQPKDTIHDLCVSTVGRYDGGILAKVRALNPELTNPDHIIIGQQLRLPLNTPDASTVRGK
jgi:general secretion pathway protein A